MERQTKGVGYEIGLLVIRLAIRPVAVGVFVAAVVGVVAAVRHPLVGIPVGILLICVLIVVVVREFRGRAAKRLTGTAQVLSVETMTKTEGPAPRYMYRIALKVKIPGRPPYDATASSGGFVDPVEMAAMRPGRNVAVNVEAANPQNVRIDFNQPIR